MKRKGDAVTIYQGTRTTVEIDRKTGVVRVWDAVTGKLMYQLRIEAPSKEKEHPCES
jgi:hypothetical protein